MFLSSFVSFPGLGIDPFEMNSVAFSIFGLDIAWYGITMTMAILLGCILTARLAVKAGYVLDDILDMVLLVIPSAVLGARLYYVLFSDMHIGGIGDLLAIHRGGLAIYGGVIGGLIAGISVAKYKKMRIARFADQAGPAMLLGMIIGRLGNFINVEAYGYETDLPWRMGIGRVADNMRYVHPTFLYEMILSGIGLVLILFMYKKKKFDGQIFLMYIGWYGLGRSLIEQLRADSLTQGSLRVSALLGAASFALATGYIIWRLIAKGKSEDLEEQCYYPGSKRYVEGKDKTDRIDEKEKSELPKESAVADFDTIESDESDDAE